MRSISSGDYVCLARDGVDINTYFISKKYIYKVVSDNGMDVIVENIHTGAKSKRVPKEYLKHVNKNILEGAMKKKLSIIEVDKSQINKILSKLTDDYDNMAVKNIQDLLNFDEDATEADIRTIISGTVAMDSFMSDVASISSLEIE
jgi:hypothetical protein